MGQNKATRFTKILQLMCRFGTTDSRDEGNVLVLVALMMVVICGIGSLALDIGGLYVQKGKLQAAADASAMAGASALLGGVSAAQDAASTIATTNDPLMTYQTAVDTVANTVTVTGAQQQPLWFARVFGDTVGTVHGKAVASMGTLTSALGIVPIGIPVQTFTPGEEVTLSAGAGDGQSGNYGFLDFSGCGSWGLESDIENGYSFPLTVGELVSTKTGVMSGPVSTAIQYRMTASDSIPGCDTSDTAQSSCSRVMYLPIINTLDLSGRKDVTILGFAAFYLDGLDGSGGHQEIMGHFLNMVRPGTLGQGTNYGTYTVKLSE